MRPDVNIELNFLSIVIDHEKDLRQLSLKKRSKSRKQKSKIKTKLKKQKKTGEGDLEARH